jgi:uncharacterized membrane protein
MMNIIILKNSAFKFTKYTILGLMIMGIAISTAHAWNFTVQATDVQPVNGVFTFPETLFQDGKAKHFQYKAAPNLWIRFFLVKSLDGNIRAAFDACDVCFSAKKGYVQQGSNMICINCGLKFRTDRINEVKGGCNPSPLGRRIQNGQIMISQQDVMSGARFFQ